MATRVIDDAKLQAIAVAVQGKDNGGVMTVDEIPERIEALNVVKPEVEPKYINFLDDDGTILYSWTEQELNEATELPPLPTEEGWTYQKWTWTLQEIKDNKFPMDVGVSRTPSNGASVRADCFFYENDNRNVYIMFNAKNDIVDVDWGDGTVDSYTFDSQSYLSRRITANHTYVQSGRYTIYLTLRNKTGKISMFTPNGLSEDSNILPSRIKLIALGKGYENISGYDFYGMVALKRISLANDAINLDGGDWINGCRSLKCVCFPRSISPTSYPRTFYNTDAVEHIILPPNANPIQSQFITRGCSIKRFNVPRSMTLLPFFSACTGLLFIYIPKSIKTVQSNAFSAIRKLQWIDFSDYDDPKKIPTLQNTNAFSNTNPNTKLYVRNQEMLDAFSAATNWSTYANQFEIGGKFGEVTT